VCTFGTLSSILLNELLAAIQHLILSTQSRDSDEALSWSHPLSIPSLFGHKGGVQPSYTSDISQFQHDVELQQTVHVVTETSRKTQYDSSENLSSSVSKGGTSSVL
jgi:hypothetical protein